MAAIEDIKKTAVANETVSEEIDEKATEKMVEKAQEEDSEKKAAEKVEAIEKAEVKDEKEAKVERKNFRRKRLTDEEQIQEVLNAWTPKTKLGLEVQSGKVKSIDEILKADKKILESEIVDSLIKVKSDLVSIGQSKGKFGGGKRRAWRQTQRKTKEGNVPTFSTLAVVGDGDGHVGIGTGKSMETLPARDKAIRQARLNIFRVERGCAAFDCDCSEKHTVPFEVTGKSGSVKVTLIPAPQGTGLVVADQLKKILKLAGIKDVYSKNEGRMRTTFNTVKACIDALKKTNVEENK